MITVVVLVYRDITCLRRTLESVFTQKDVELELIVSDDCSDNISLDMLENIVNDVCAFENKRNIQTIIRKNEKNMGIVAHVNLAFSMARGKLIAPLSCGDIFYHEYILRNIKDFFLENQCLIATARRECFVGDTGEIMGLLPTHKQTELIKIGGRKLINSICRGNFICGAATYYSAELFQKYGGFDENMFLIEDYPKYLRLLFSGEKIYFIDEVTIKYQLGGVSTGNKNSLFVKDMQTIYEQVIIPHKMDIGWSTYRYLLCREFYSKYGILKGALHCLLYPDVIVMKIISLITNQGKVKYEHMEKTK